MEQTKINEENWEKFYKRLYPVLTMSKQNLIDISRLSGTKVIVDSAGWYYQEHFSGDNVIKIEHVNTCKNFKLDKSKFDKMFNDVSFPNITDQTVLILDHSAFLKYKTVDQLKELLSMMAKKCNSNYIIVRGSMVTLNDYRFGDRIKDFVNVILDDFIATKLSCNLDQYWLEMKKIKKDDIN